MQKDIRIESVCDDCCTAIASVNCVLARFQAIKTNKEVFPRNRKEATKTWCWWEEEERVGVYFPILPQQSYKENSDSEEEVKDDQEEEAEEPEEEAPNKKSKGDSKERNGMKWHEDGTLYYLTCSDYKGSDKIVGFDMDSTLVEPKSGAKFPRNRTDWVWLYPEIPDKLKQLHKDG